MEVNNEFPTTQAFSGESITKQIQNPVNYYYDHFVILYQQQQLLNLHLFNGWLESL